MLVIICRIGQKPRAVSLATERPVYGVVCDITSEHHWARAGCCVTIRVESRAHEPIWSAIFAANCVCGGSIDCDGEDLPSLHIGRGVCSIEEHCACRAAPIEKACSNERRLFIFIRVKLIPLIRVEAGSSHDPANYDSI
jgi:hypothetical protein